MRKSTSLPVISLLAVSLALSGCASNSGAGAAVGAVAGAIIGKSTGNNKKKRLFIGAAVGALAGSAIGRYMDNQEAAFRNDLADSGIDVVREGNNIRLVMPSNVTFASAQSAISPSFNSTLDAIARVMKKYDKTFLAIEGHSDSTGDKSFNMTLSEKRAESVKTYLLFQGVQKDRVDVSGYGDTQPVASNATSQGRAKNRRVEIQIIPNEAK